jgi:hypothetical protein
MANITINGCVNRATGEVIFEGAACDSGNYIGCIVRSGEHAGQVAIIVNEASCEDTYYGCIDRSTGQFKVEIPDNCCAVGCANCTGGTPYRVYLQLTGITICEPCFWASSNYYEKYNLLSDLNSLHTLTQDSYAGAECYWGTTLLARRRRWTNSTCSGVPTIDDEQTVDVRVWKSAPEQVTIAVWKYFTGPYTRVWFYVPWGAGDGNCFNPNITHNNSLTACYTYNDGYSGFRLARGGSARVSGSLMDFA